MSFSSCIKCQEMVGQYEKYCNTCVNKYSLSSKQDVNFHRTKDWSGLNYTEECERIFNEDTAHMTVKKPRSIGFTGTTIAMSKEAKEMHEEALMPGSDKYKIEKQGSVGKGSIEDYASKEVHEMHEVLAEGEKARVEYQYLHKRKGPAVPPAVSTKIDRNSMCPCGSGKKYKKCCL